MSKSHRRDPGAQVSPRVRELLRANRAAVDLELALTDRHPFVSRRVGLCMARKPKIQTRVPEDTHERFEKYREARGLTKADATRRLVEAGLESEPLHADADATSSQMSPVIQMAGGGLTLLAATILLAVQLPAAAAATVAAAIGAAIGGSLR